MRKQKIIFAILGGIFVIAIIVMVLIAVSQGDKNNGINESDYSFENVISSSMESNSVDTESTSEEESSLAVVETTVASVQTMTNADFKVVINDRPELECHVTNLDMNMTIPSGNILGISFSEIKSPTILRLDGEYDGKQVRNFWNTDQQNTHTDNGIKSQVTGSSFVEEFILTGTIYSCTALVSGCENLISADLSGCNNPYGFYQFQLLFEECRGLKKCILPADIKEISMGMFKGCSSLESIELPSDIESIDAFAFYGCDHLKELIIPDKVSYIGDKAFDRCDELTIVASKGSVAYTYAISNGLKIKEK